jgi:putative DNA primase/helicase
LVPSTLLNASPEVGRVADVFGLVAAAGELATAEGITGWKVAEAIRGAAACFRAWLDNRGTTGGADVEAGIRAVRLFIQQHGGSRFDSDVQLDGTILPQRIFNRVGFKRTNSKTSFAEYLVFPEVFRSEICKGFDHKIVAAELAKRGFLVTEGRHLTVRRSLPDSGETSVYAIRAAVIDG